MYDAAYDPSMAPVAIHSRFERAEPRLAAPAQSGAKRCLDIVAAGLILVLLLPVLVLVALLVRLESPGPALFRQRRGGVMGAPFVIYKFRTMRVLEDGDDLKQATRQDARITRIGALLRRTSVDELPQLLNVLKGDMSLVGPRPHALAHDRAFEEALPEYRRRFAVKPGITGLAQVRGFRGETSELEQIRGRLEWDLRYIERWTIWRDLLVLLATLKTPLDRRAY